MLKMIDVSGWQGDNIDWLRVRDAGVGVVAAKSSGTEGNAQYQDRTYDININAIRAMGKVTMGAYHYCSLDYAPGEQAEFFYRAAKLRGGIDIPPALDLEAVTGKSKAQAQEYVRTLADRTRTVFGCLPILYSSWWGWMFQYMFDANQAIPEWFKQYPLWIANYPTDPPPPFEKIANGTYKPYMPPQHPNGWMFWQYSEKGRVDGISADASLNVDLDVFRGDDAELKTLIDYCWSAGKKVATTLTSKDRYYALKDAQLERAAVNDARVDLTGKLSIGFVKDIYRPDERIEFAVNISNWSAETMQFGVIGVEIMNTITGEKAFKTVRNNLTLLAGVGMNLGDELQISNEGSYALSFHVCKSSVEEAIAGKGDWVKLTEYIQIKVERYRSRGVVCEMFDVENPVVKAGEQIWFKFKVVNQSENEVAYNILSVRTEHGSSGQSWTNQVLKPHQVLEWRDNIRLYVAAEHPMFLGMFFGGVDRGLRNQEGVDLGLAIDAKWERLTNSVMVTVL